MGSLSRWGWILAPFGLVVALTMCDSDQIACGPGTVEVDYECVALAEGGAPEGGASPGGMGGEGGGARCGPGTVEVDGICQPESVEAIAPSPEDMAAYACDVLGNCDAAEVIAYWTKVITEPPYDETTWDDHAVQRTVTFEDDGAALDMNYRFTITDTVTGDPADLSFEVGIPVTLRLVNSADGASGKHFLTAPAYFRTVAWRKAETSEASYTAPTFDAFMAQHDAASDKVITLYFVPIEPSSHTAYCQIGVANGSSYKGIIDGTVTPDLLTGHAGKGMKHTIATVDPAELHLRVFQGSLPRTVADDDPRRSGSDPVWAGSTGDDGVVCTGDANELVACRNVTLTEVSSEALEYTPSSLTLTKDTAYIVRLTNPAGNNKHSFAGTDFFKDCVLRKAQDAQGEVDAPYLDAVELKSPEVHTAELWLVPALLGTYTNYCRIGVQHSNGAPNLRTGHAGMGMHMSITVE